MPALDFLERVLPTLSRRSGLVYLTSADAKRAVHQRRSCAQATSSVDLEYIAHLASRQFLLQGSYSPRGPALARLCTEKQTCFLPRSSSRFVATSPPDRPQYTLNFAHPAWDLPIFSSLTALSWPPGRTRRDAAMAICYDCHIPRSVFRLEDTGTHRGNERTPLQVRAE